MTSSLPSLAAIGLTHKRLILALMTAKQRSDKSGKPQDSACDVPETVEPGTAALREQPTAPVLDHSLALRTRIPSGSPFAASAIT